MKIVTEKLVKKEQSDSEGVFNSHGTREPVTAGSEPILVEMRHFRKSRPEVDTAKSSKIKFQ